MKDLKHIKSFNEQQENLNISDVMKRSLEYYRYIQVFIFNIYTKLIYEDER